MGEKIEKVVLNKIRAYQDAFPDGVKWYIILGPDETIPYFIKNGILKVTIEPVEKPK